MSQHIDGRPNTDEISEESDKRGIGKNELKEDPKKCNKRDKDNVIQGPNGSYISLGRDRIPQYGTNTAGVFGGYGGKGFQGVGAIDLVAGISAPFIKDAASKLFNPIFIQETISEKERQKYPDGDHPGVAMDAARIYMSQKTDIDAAFQCSPGLTNPSPPAHDDPKLGHLASPRSGIGMIADEVRINARQGIKIISGPLRPGAYNSVGGEIQAIYGIDLIAGNGEKGGAGKQEPLVKGFALATALDELVTLISDITGIVSTLFQIQFGYNIAVGTHWHPEPVLLGMPGIPSPVLAKSAMPILIVEVMQKLITSLVNHEINLSGYSVTYLTPTTEKYINSSYNSTN
jgi:hypothetical protein